MAKFNNNKKGNKKNYSNHKSNTKMVTFRKEFDSFASAITDMKDHSEVIKNILDTEEDNPTSEAVYKKLAEAVKEHLPNPVKRENMHWEFNIAGSRVSVKTGEYIAFGWNVRSKKVETDDSSTYQNHYYCRITVFGSNPDLVEDLTSNGWYTEEDEEK